MLRFATEEEPRYAGFWIRAAARIIDLILLLAAFQLFLLIDQEGAEAGWWTATGFGDPFGSGRLLLENMARGFFFLAFPVLYYVYLHGAYGQTVGKMVLGIRVRNEDGSSLTYRKAFFRWFGYLLCDLTLNFGYVWAAFDPRKQGLHDKVCGTVVIHERTASGA